MFCILIFKRAVAVVLGSLGVRAGPARCRDEQAERDSCGTGWKQHGRVRAEDNQPYGEARFALSSLQSTGSVWKTVVSKHQAGLPQSCAVAWREWALLPDVKAGGRQDCCSVSCFRYV